MPLSTAQWTLTITLLVGAITTPILGRLCSGRRRRSAIVLTVAVVVTGSVLAVLPLGFHGLLAGRAAQGVGLGLTAPLIAVARDALEPARARSTIAQISIAATFGIGAAYPMAGWLTDVGGVRLAYTAAASAVAGALVLAVIVLPSASGIRPASLDVVGAALLAAVLTLLLIVASTTALWQRAPGTAVAGMALAAGLFVLWVRHERHCTDPLVDVRSLSAPRLAVANLSTFVAGIGAYGLQTLIGRYVQTPTAAGYGVNGTTLTSGLVLVPFAVTGVLGGWLAHRRTPAGNQRIALAGGATVMTAGFVLFATLHASLIGALVAMAVLGAGAGAFNSVMPGLLMHLTHRTELASMMAVNQLVRTLGFASGSALAGLVLAVRTPPGFRFPDESAYSTACWCGVAVMGLAIWLCRPLKH